LACACLQRAELVDDGSQRPALADELFQVVEVRALVLAGR
jgi:hypothetical protein